MRRFSHSSLVVLIMIAALAVSVWSTCGFAVPAQQASDAAAPQGHADRCPSDAPATPYDPCDVDHRLEVGLVSQGARATLEHLDVAHGPVIELIQIVHFLVWPAVTAAHLEPPVLKLPHAPLYLVFSVFLI